MRPPRMPAFRRRLAAGALALLALVSGPAPGAVRAQVEIGSPLLRSSGPPRPWGVWYQPGTVFDPGGSSLLEFFGPNRYVPRAHLLAKHWILRTHDCPQVVGTEPWVGLRVFQVDGSGCLVPHGLGALLAQAARHPVVFVVHGNLAAGQVAVNESLYIHDALDRVGALPPDAVVVGFDWPSQKVRALGPFDAIEKARRAFVAAYHLARVVQILPAGSRACLIGHSAGGQAVMAALHLLGGGVLRPKSLAGPAARLPACGPDLRLRGVLVGSSGDHHWFDPGARLDRALVGCEALLNLYNSGDEVLAPYVLDIHSDHRLAIGLVGLTNRDLARLGPLAARYAERDLAPHIGRDHTLVGAVVDPQVAAWIAPYTWATRP